jgi:methylglutaconyl-CoA hydratase
VNYDCEPCSNCFCHPQRVVPGACISRVPRARAALVNEWALTGEPFDAKAAQAAGLLNYVVPSAELDTKVEWLIGRIVDKSPTAIRRGKYAMRAIASMSFDESIAYTESQIALLAMTEDAKEGLKAFSEKRKPSWPGK